MAYSAEALGQVVREHRVARNLTQEHLGVLAGYAAGAGAGVSLSRIESGLTRVGRGRLERIAHALDVAPDELEHEALDRTRQLAAGDSGGPVTGETLAERAKRISAELERRATVINELGDAFNAAYDRARDEFVLPFVEWARSVDAPLTEETPLERTEEPDDNAGPAGEATWQIKVTIGGVKSALAGGTGGAAAGAALGSAAAYGSFRAAVAYGTSSTGRPISMLHGAARTRAAFALLGRGTIANGGSGAAGGARLLQGLIMGPALLFAIGGLAAATARSQKKRRELAQRLAEADAELHASRRGYDAVIELLPQATQVLDYIATHASHALRRWNIQFEQGPLHWDTFDDADRRRYQDFIEVAAAQLSVETIDVEGIMTSGGDEREHLILFADEVLTQARNVVQTLV